MGRYESRLKKLEVKNTPRKLYNFEIHILEDSPDGLFETREGERLNSKDYAAYCKRNGDILIGGPEDED